MRNRTKRNSPQTPETKERSEQVYSFLRSLDKNPVVCTTEDLASVLGLSVRTLARVLRELKQDGLIVKEPVGRSGLRIWTGARKPQPVLVDHQLTGWEERIWLSLRAKAARCPARVTLDWITDHVGCSRATASRAVRRLTDSGWMRRWWRGAEGIVIAIPDDARAAWKKRKSETARKTANRSRRLLVAEWIVTEDTGPADTDNEIQIRPALQSPAAIGPETRVLTFVEGPGGLACQPDLDDQQPVQTQPQLQMAEPDETDRRMLETLVPAQQAASAPTRTTSLDLGEPGLGVASGNTLAAEMAQNNVGGDSNIAAQNGRDEIPANPPCPPSLVPYPLIPPEPQDVLASMQSQPYCSYEDRLRQLRTHVLAGEPRLLDAQDGGNKGAITEEETRGSGITQGAGEPERPVLVLTNPREGRKDRKRRLDVVPAGECKPGTPSQPAVQPDNDDDLDECKLPEAEVKRLAQVFIRAWCRIYRRKNKARYQVRGGRDGLRAKQLVRLLDGNVEIFTWLVENLWDSWRVPPSLKRAAMTIHGFAEQWNVLIPTMGWPFSPDGYHELREMVAEMGTCGHRKIKVGYLSPLERVRYYKENNVPRDEIRRIEFALAEGINPYTGKKMSKKMRAMTVGLPIPVLQEDPRLHYLLPTQDMPDAIEDDPNMFED